MSTSASIGRFQISTVQDHPSPEREPSVVFPSVRASAWDPYRSFALSPEGKYQSQWRGHLIQSALGDGPKVLVDTGMGPGPFEHTGRNGELLTSLAGLGVKPEDVDAVVTTHVHGDHIGWNVLWDSGKAKPTFPNAKYYVAASDWEHYSKPENSNPAFRRSVHPLEELGVLELVTGEIEVASGIKTLPANGHTPGHQCVLVESDGQTGVLTGDLFHNVAQITEQTWCPTFDWDTRLSTASRQSVLGAALEHGWIVFSGHLPINASIGRVVDRGGKPAWDPV